MLAGLPSNTLTFSETIASDTYYYRVQAFNSTTGRSSDYSNILSVRLR